MSCPTSCAHCALLMAHARPLCIAGDQEANLEALRRHNMAQPNDPILVSFHACVLSKKHSYWALRTTLGKIMSMLKFELHGAQLVPCKGVNWSTTPLTGVSKEHCHGLQ